MRAGVVIIGMYEPPALAGMMTSPWARSPSALTNSMHTCAPAGALTEGSVIPAMRNDSAGIEGEASTTRCTFVVVKVMVRAALSMLAPAGTWLVSNCACAGLTRGPGAGAVQVVPEPVVSAAVSGEHDRPDHRGQQRDPERHHGQHLGAHQRRAELERGITRRSANLNMPVTTVPAQKHAAEQHRPLKVGQLASVCMELDCAGPSVIIRARSSLAHDYR